MPDNMSKAEGEEVVAEVPVAKPPTAGKPDTKEEKNTGGKGSAASKGDKEIKLEDPTEGMLS
jgi:hypothetical protein